MLSGPPTSITVASSLASLSNCTDDGSCRRPGTVAPALAADPLLEAGLDGQLSLEGQHDVGGDPVPRDDPRRRSSDPELVHDHARLGVDGRLGDVEAVQGECAGHPVDDADPVGTARP